MTAPLSRAYTGTHRVKGARSEIALTGAWPWPIAKLLEVHDGDTAKFAIDHGFGEDAKEWIRLRDVWAPEVDEPGGSEATADCQGWFREHAPDGYVQVTTFRTSTPLEIRFRQSFTRYIGIVTAFNGSELNSYLIDKGYVARGGAP
jgi:hypothetical protein